MTASANARPGAVSRLRSRQSGLPAGVLGRIVGRAMERATAAANERAVGALGLGAPCTVLDVGFGQGRTVAALVRDGHRVLGVDPSKTMVRQATARNRSACRAGLATLRHGDGITIPFADGSADAAITAHTIYFMPDPAATLAEVARVLRPGGIFAITCRTSDTATPSWMDPAVYRIPTAAQIVALVRAVGLELTEHQPGDGSNDEVHLFVTRAGDG